MEIKKVLFVTSECVPFAKTGGLADVSSALPKALKKEGVDIRIVMPRYYIVDKEKYKLKPLEGELVVPMGKLGNLYAQVFEGMLPNSDVKVYFIEYEDFFGRKGLYDDNNIAYKDNDIRFIFLSKASIELSKKIDFIPDIFHCNDWQSSALNIILNTKYALDSTFSHTASVLSIHNINYQGKFDKSALDYLECDYKHFNMYELEDFGGVNLLKGGIKFCDAITTVSPTYAKEIQTPEFGCGLDQHIKGLNYKLFGILNGVDYDEWNPKTDNLIKQKYSVSSINKKSINKKDLQKIFDLPQKNVPMFGFIGRLVEQKGIELIASIFEEFIQEDIQFIMLGTGEKWAEDFFRNMENKYPDKFKCYIGYNNEMAHKIEAGVDIFLMPSLFEPCGLNQMYSCIYGTLPLVRGTGGLEDSIINFDEKDANGFKFYEASPMALINTIKWAISSYYSNRFKKVQKNAMKKDFSWKKSAKLYKDVYMYAKLPKLVRR